MEGKKANEKKNLVYELKSIENKSLSFNVIYSEKGKTTKTADIVKVAKKSDIELNEEELKKAFQVFEKQSNVDYFINKDAKRFLSEQLDMWIYQYMFSQEVDFNMERFSQIQDFKKIASKLINFISQFENELVKIWNKPRFVINSNIVVTLDKLTAKGFEIDRLKNHPNFNLQQQEWEELGISQGNGLVENEFLPIDTKYFTEFKEEIESLFSEDEFDGLLIKSENYQALNTIQPRFKGKVDLIYIDPPFNTGDDFAYIDRFQDSTWLSLMENRLEIAKEILSKKGSFFLHLDNNANYMGKQLLNKFFTKEQFRNEIIWCYAGGGIPKKELPKKHDTILNSTKSDNFIFNAPMRQYSQTGSGRRSDGTLYDLNDLTPHNDWWTDIATENTQSKSNIGFLTQKPEPLLQRIINMSSKDNSIILDYHLGSGTTISTAHKLGRKWIGIEMGEHFDDFYINKDETKMGIKGRMKLVLSGAILSISKELEESNLLKKGGIFKYYELEQYEQILRSTKYKDTPNDYLKSKESDEIKDCFLFDEKLSEVITPLKDSFKVDLSKLHPNIDLKETIHNLTGKRPNEITDTKVIFEDKEFELLEILKPLLVW